ncbi:MAG: dipeptide epimerase [Planctomyces sp.]|nr:dipeptide epimerase [Planctomyces sp.]
MKMTLREYRLQLRNPFTTSHGTDEIQTTLIVELRDGEFGGYGEAPDNFYFNVSTPAVRRRLEEVRGLIEGTPWERPEELWENLKKPLAGCSFGLCAVDQAAHDLWGKRLGEPVHRLWGLSPEKAPFSDYTIGIDPVETMVERLKQFPGWPIYKIKLGTKDDINIVRELRKHTDAVFRVDANTAWTAAETIQNSRAMKGLGVEYIEQPLKAHQWEDSKRVYLESELPIIADESCVLEEDVLRCVGYFHGINIKLSKCGGLTPGRRMALQARELGLKIMIGCMTETTVGISAITQLLPLLDYADTDGALLLKDDIARGVRVEKGKVIYPCENGCGVTLTHEPDAFLNKTRPDKCVVGA